MDLQLAAMPSYSKTLIVSFFIVVVYISCKMFYVYIYGNRPTFIRPCTNNFVQSASNQLKNEFNSLFESKE